MSKSKKRFDLRLFIFISVSLIVYKCMLEYVYITVIEPVFSYQYYAPSYGNLYTLKKEIISWIVTFPVIILLFRNSQYRDFSRQVWSMILIVSYIPGLVFYIYNDMPYFILFLLYFLSFAVSIELIPCLRFRISQYAKRPTRTVMAFVLGMSAIIIWVYYSRFHIQLSILDVYGTRAEAASYRMPILLSYLFSIAHYVLPLYTIFSFYYKKYKSMVFYIIVLFLIFCIDGSKKTVFIVLFSFASYYLIEYTKEYTRYIPILMAIIGIAGIIETKLLNTCIVISLFYRRMLFLPILLNNYYFDFFNKHELDYFRQSIELFGKSPYTSISKTIGSEYLAIGTNANNGLFSDAYANLGEIGMFIMPFVLVLLLKMFDGATVKMTQRLYISCVIECVLLYMSGSFLTNLLTHGLAFIFITLYLFDGEKKTWKNKSV